MQIRKVEWKELSLSFRANIQTSYGVQTAKHFFLLALEDEQGFTGYGELEAFELPDYTEETLEGAFGLIRGLLLPLLMEQEISHPREVRALFGWIRGNEMAKAAVETAVWDLHAKRKGISLAELLGTQRSTVPVGVSIGIQPTPEALVKTVGAYLKEGYQRIKIKIKPGSDYEHLKAVREAYPSISMMADANSAYEWQDIELLKKIDTLDLEMIEQPFGVNDLFYHAELQKQLQTKICLDENIRSLADLEQAYRLGSCQAVNLKIARVGGIAEALDIISFCVENKLLVWCGGMYEAGIGRAFNLALAGNEAFTFPGDISATDRYFEKDILTEDFVLENGSLRIPSGIGIGVELREDLSTFTKSEGTYYFDKKEGE